MTEGCIDVASSVLYLSSPEAIEEISCSGYWPKWTSPWWHMSLLHELGETKQIPASAVHKLVEVLNSIPQKEFPVAAGADPNIPYPCHCQIGNIYQILWSWGLNVDEELSWLRPYMLKYQMSDGGVSCDYEAYAATDECPSSMVGTIAVFEALLLCTPRSYTTEEELFLQKAADFLIKRKLSMGSKSAYNAEERVAAEQWDQLCFPRFYFYDTLRGLSALLEYSEKLSVGLPIESVSGVINDLSLKFPDGQVVLGRQAFANRMTKRLNADGQWDTHRVPAETFPLLEVVSEIGAVSPTLSKQWAAVQNRARRLNLVK